MADREHWWFYVEELASLARQGFAGPSSPNQNSTTQAANPEDSDRRISKIIAEKNKWAPFSCIDRDRLEDAFAKTDPAERNQAVSAHSGQRLWLADLQKFEMAPLYWKGGSVVPLRRSLWMIMLGEDDTQGAIPCPKEWEILLEEIIQQNLTWLQYGMEGDESQTAEKIVQMTGLLENYSLILKRGVMSMSTLLPNAPKTQPSRISSLMSASPPKPIRLIRGYSAYYTAIVTALKNPNELAQSAPNTSMDPPPKAPKIPPSPFELTPSADQMRPRPVKHVVFVVHGIGQKLAEKVGHGFVIAINSLRRYILSAGKPLNLELEDVYTLPIEWRVDLDMGSGYFSSEEDSAQSEFDSLVTAITLPSVPAVRTLATDVTMDVLLYMTPRHFNRIIEACIKEIKRVYALFRKWNTDPDDTKISIIGHSLGSALVSDMLGITLDCDSAAGSDLSYAMQQIKDRIGFQVENFFSLGSPLPLFMLLKHVKPAACCHHEDLDKVLSDAKRDFVSYSTDSHPKMGFLACKQLFNLFMPYDPVAYRFEPLVVPPSARGDILDPVTVPYRKGGMTGLKLGMVESISKTRQGMIEAVNRSLPQWMRERIASPGLTSIEDASKSPSPSLSSSILRRFNDSGRVDYSLQDSLLENPYLSSVSSHFSYWSDEDVAAFLLDKLFSHPLNQH